jgi:hypothetical protein
MEKVSCRQLINYISEDPMEPCHAHWRRLQRTVATAKLVNECRPPLLACMMRRLRRRRGATPHAHRPPTRPLPSGPAAAAAAAGRRRRFGRLRFLALRNLAPLMGDSWEGLVAACAAAQADPSDCELWGSIAALAARLGDLALSRHATERALALRPRAAPPAERLVLLLGAAGDWRGAVRALRLLGRADGAHPWW